MRGAWIEISPATQAAHRRRSLPVRGAWIEIRSGQLHFWRFASLPVRGAWIEILVYGCPNIYGWMSLPVRGAWIEINPQRGGEDEGKRRSPCGERGLKWLAISEWLEKRVSLPVRGAWIEILLQRRVLQDKRESLPVRGAWIEIIHDRICGRTIVVAPRAGSVD